MLGQGNDLHLHKGRLILDIRKNFLLDRVVRGQAAQGVVESPSPGGI